MSEPLFEGMRKVYDEIGTAAGNLGDEDGDEVVGLLFPTGRGEDDCDEVFMTLPCAKALLIDLRDAIEACVKHKNGEYSDGDTELQEPPE